MTRRLVPAVAILAALSTMACASRVRTCTRNFQEQATLIPMEGVQNASGLVVADMDGDGTQDIIVASGGDSQTSRILIHYGKPGLPDWQSEDVDYNARVVAGDVNKDGLLDLAVAVFPPPSVTPSKPVAAKLYLSKDGTLPVQPALFIPPAQAGLYSPEVALGDANGDGALDLAVATLLSAQDQQTPQYIYFNKGGTLDTSTPWVSETQVQANAVRFLDLDDDGLMDLVFTAPTRNWGWAFKGYRTAEGKPGIATQTTSFHLSRKYPQMLYTVDFDTSPPGPAVSSNIFAAHSNHYCATKDCKGFVAMYDGQGTMQWKSEEEGMASVVRNADLDGDGTTDAVAGFWSSDPRCTQPQDCPTAGPLYAYCGSGPGMALRGERLAGTERFLIERMTLTDLNGDATVARTYAVPKVSSGTAAKFVVTLPVRAVMGITSLRRNGQQVAASQYVFTPGANWVALGEPIGPEDQVEIGYMWASAVDIVIADDVRKNVIPVIYHRDPRREP